MNQSHTHGEGMKCDQSTPTAVTNKWGVPHSLKQHPLHGLISMHFNAIGLSIAIRGPKPTQLFPTKIRVLVPTNEMSKLFGQIPDNSPEWIQFIL